MLLDGSRDLPALRKDLFELFKSGNLTLQDGDQRVVDLQMVERRISAETEQTLQELARAAVLMK